MKTIFLLATIALQIHSQGEKVPLSSNFDCQYYQEAILNKSDPFSPNFTPDSSKYYSQAPEGQSLGKCNVIPCIGSPVFIIEKAHTYINQQFDIGNQQATVKLVAFNLETKGGAYNVVKYRLVFELGNYLGSKYIGVQVDSPI